MLFAIGYVLKIVFIHLNTYFSKTKSILSAKMAQQFKILIKQPLIDYNRQYLYVKSINNVK